MAATAVAHVSEEGVPYDTFGARLALVRQALGGWNVKKAADLCGLNDQSWRNWEAGASKVQDMEGVCKKISAATGFSYEWLMVGGPLLRSRCTLRGLPSVVEPELPFDVPRELVVVSGGVQQ